MLPGMASPIMAGGRAYDPASTAYFAAMTTPPSDGRKALLDDFIRGLKADGIWNGIDWISIQAGHASQAGLINARTPSQIATLINNPVFTVDRGFMGINNGGTEIRTPAAANAALRSSQNSLCLFGYNNINHTATEGCLVATTSSSDSLIQTSSNNGGNVLCRVNTQNNLFYTATASAIGFVTANRDGATSQQLFRNGQQIASGSTTSRALTSDTYSFLAGGPYVTAADRVAISGWGASLSAAQQLAFYNRVMTYLNSIGAA